MRATIRHPVPQPEQPPLLVRILFERKGCAPHGVCFCFQMVRALLIAGCHTTASQKDLPRTDARGTLSQRPAE